MCAADVTADCYNSCVHCTYAPPVAACYFSYPSGPPPIVSGGRGIVFDRFLCFFVYLFICLFVCQQDYEKTAGPICMKFSGRCGVTMGRPDSILGQFRETARCRDANFYVSICKHYQQSALLAVLCCHLVTENVMNFSTSQHGGGVCCAFAPHLVYICNRQMSPSVFSVSVIS